MSAENAPPVPAADPGQHGLARNAVSLYGAFYAIAALNNTWYYRAQLRSKVRNLVTVGLLPVAAAGFLIWVIVRSVAAFTSGENLTLVAVLVSGLAVLIFAQVVKRSPFFNLRPVKYEEAEAQQREADARQ